MKLGNAHRVLEYLDGLPFKELHTTAEMACQLGIHMNDFSLKQPEMLKRRAKIAGNRVVWGSLKTVTSLKKRMEIVA